MSEGARDRHKAKRVGRSRTSANAIQSVDLLRGLSSTLDLTILDFTNVVLTKNFHASHTAWIAAY
jgi:hypothetical protein